MKMLGLGHIGIDRRSSTLSGGEGQRVRLAQQLTGSLCGMIFVLDEPTIGLHNKDVGMLLKVINQLKDKGNTIIIVEHDREVIKWADNIIEIGPGSGREGGSIVAQGTYDEFVRSDEAITPPYLRDNILPKPIKRRLYRDAFRLGGVNKYNLVDRDFSFDAGGIIAITGVSGSGKSTLIHHVLVPSLTQGKAINCYTYYNRAGFDQYMAINNRGINGNYLSTLASYSGLLYSIGSLFAASEEAKAKHLTGKSFSYNSKEGRCPLCIGAGKIRISMDFMDDVWNNCDSCKGLRYNDNILVFRLHNLNIAEVLQLTVEEAIAYFKVFKSRKADSVMYMLLLLKEIGLGHLVLGQETGSLSAGEAQRLKLSLKLSEGSGEKILFMLDEPSSGLHYKDLENLINVFNRLVDNGHTVMFIEHNPYMIAIANQVIEL